MEYGAIDLHKKESQIRILTEGGEVTRPTDRDDSRSLDGRVLGTAADAHVCSRPRPRVSGSRSTWRRSATR